MEVSNDRQKALVWGAILGDVIGAYVQNDKAVTEQKLKAAFTICGGGIRKLEPGQPTDDSELTLAVAKALSASKSVLNLNKIATEMGNWFLSKPIDVGNTIRNSVPKACNMKEHQAHVVRKGAAERSQDSQSNGTLMCISPLALWCRKLPDEHIQKCVREFTILIHPNETVVLANTFYVFVCVYLINNPLSESRAVDSFNKAKEWASKKGNSLLNQWISTIEQTRNNFEGLLEKVPPHKAQGWIRIAFIYAMHFLLCENISFRQAITKVIGMRGDTDTNACIIGALLGAKMGLTKMDMGEQLQKIKAFKGVASKRPDWLNPGKSLEKYLDLIIQTSPTELKIEGGQVIKN